MATGTVIPWLTEQFEDSNGTPLNGGFVFTYLAGTTTPVATYTDVGLTTPHANPIVLNSSGRPSSGGSDLPIYLTPGVSYKFLIQNSASVTIVTRDNISAIPASTQGLDIVGTVGENITANQAVYLSDGSGGKTQGQWYRADTTNAYSSTGIEVGVALGNITSGTSGTIRLAGSTPGFSALTTGASYYLSSTPGTLSVTPSATNYRLVGQSDSSTSMVMFGGSSPVNPKCQAFNNGTQSLTNATDTACAFNSEDFDTAALHDTATNNTRITVPTGGDGVYLLSAQLNFTNSAVGERYLYLRKNGTTAINSRTITAGLAGTNGHVLVNTALVVLIATDYVEAVAWQNSGGNLNIGGIRPDANQLFAAKLW